MTIDTITPELHAELEAIAAEHPELVFQNVGYEYLPPDVLKTAPALRVTEILKKHVVGFVKFFNFCHDKTGRLELRFDYGWNADNPGAMSFTGVGYLALDELLNGFDAHKNPETICKT